MVGKRDRWLNQLAHSLEEQGCRVRTGSKALYVVYPPDGGMFSIHRTVSDRRGIQNLRKSVEQHGLTWPFNTTPNY